MMGAAMALSLDSMRENMSTSALMYKVTRRSCILFALGILVNGNYQFPTFRVMGVLQVGGPPLSFLLQ